VRRTAAQTLLEWISPPDTVARLSRPGVNHRWDAGVAQGGPRRDQGLSRARSRCARVSVGCATSHRLEDRDNERPTPGVRDRSCPWYTTSWSTTGRDRNGHQRIPRTRPRTGLDRDELTRTARQDDRRRDGARRPTGPARPAMDPGAGVHRGVHVVAGHHRGERGPALDSAGSARQPAGSAMGERRLRPGARRAAAPGGHPGRQAGPTPALPGGPGRLSCGSLACALAPAALALELFRALQGIGGAVLFATATPLLRAEFSGAALARALGVFGATLGVPAPSGHWSVDS